MGTAVGGIECQLYCCMSCKCVVCVRTYVCAYVSVCQLGELCLCTYIRGMHVCWAHGCLLCCQKPQGHCGEIGPAIVIVMGLGTPQSVSRHRPHVSQGPIF